MKIIERTQNHLIIKFAEKQVKSYFSQTSARVAYFFDKFVIKFDSAYNDLDAELEFYNWNKIEMDDRKYFAEVFSLGSFEGKNFVVQERVFPDKNAKKLDNHYKILSNLKDKYQIYDIILDADWSDSGTHNVFIDVAGNLKIFDYVE